MSLLEHPWFERVAMGVIFMNCVTLALYDPTDADCETEKCKVLYWLENAFTVFFVLEMFVKWLAMGVWGEGAYLSDPWNRLDCAIVLLGVIDWMPFLSLGGLTLFRALRALRPLRTINKLPGLRVLITLLLDTLPMMANIFGLCCLIVLVFSIVGVQLWKGVYRQRCFITQDQYYDPDGFGLAPSYTCSTSDNNGWVECPPVDQYERPIASVSGYTGCTTVGV